MGENTIAKIRPPGGWKLIFKYRLNSKFQIVKIRPLGGWKLLGTALTSLFQNVKIRPLGGWKLLTPYRSFRDFKKLKSDLLEDGFLCFCLVLFCLFKQIVSMLACSGRLFIKTLYSYIKM